MKLKLLILSTSLLLNTASAACINSNTVSSAPLNVNPQGSRIAYVWLTNTSKETLDTSITIYNSDGIDVTPHILTGDTVRTINSKGSTGYSLKGKTGYGGTFHTEVTWTSQTCLKTPLTGSVETQIDSNIMVIPINAGKEF